MSEFSDYLNEIRNNRNMSVAEMAKVSEIDVTTMFRWTKGERLPENREYLERLTKSLRLNKRESDSLSLVYGRSRYGKKCFDDYTDISKMIIESKKEVHNSLSEKCSIELKLNMKLLDDNSFAELKGKSQVVNVIRLFILNALKNHNSLYVKSHIPNKEINSMITTYSTIYSPVEIEEIMIPEEGVAIDNTQNMSILNEIVNMAIHNTNCEVYMCSNLETDICNRNCLLSGNVLMKFSDDYSEGIITSCSEWIDMAKEFHCRLKGYGYKMVINNAEEYINEKINIKTFKRIDIPDEQCEIYCIYVSIDEDIALIGIKSCDSKRLLEIRNEEMVSSIRNFVDVLEKSGEDNIWRDEISVIKYKKEWC